MIATLPKLIDGRFKLTKVIGQGGNGVVYEAEQVGFDRRVAVKLLSKQISHESSELGRFEIEAQALSSLSNKHITAFYAYGVTDGTPYIAMELLDGITLRQLIQQNSRLSWRQTLEIIRDISEALSHAHARGILHRDLKPENVSISQTESGRIVKITDFGLAKLTDNSGRQSQQQLTKAGYAVGTPFYMSPEQYAGGALTPACDIYGLGCVMYECLFGRVPLITPDPESFATDELPLAAGDKRNKTFDTILMVLRGALQPDPTKRHITAEEIKNICVDLLSSDKSDSLITPRLGKQRSKQTNSLLGISVLAIAMACVLSIAVFHYSNNTKKTETVETATKKGPENTCAYYIDYASRRITEDGRPKEIVEALRKAEALLSKPENKKYQTRVDVLLASQLNRDGLLDWKGSTDYCNKIFATVKPEPYNLDYSAALEYMATNLSEQGKWTDCCKWLRQKALKYECTGQNSCRKSVEAEKLIQAYYNATEFQKAIDAFHEYEANITPRYPPGDSRGNYCYGHLAFSYYRLNRYKEALPCFLRLVNPTAEQLRATAVCFRSVGRTSEAEDCDKRASAMETKPKKK